MNLSVPKTPSGRRPGNEAGGTLLLTLMMAVVIGMTLASYLTMVSAHNRAVMRSLAWNSTLPVVEAGIEEALTQLHECGLTNLSRNGWEVVQPGPGGRFLKRRSLSASRYEVAIFAHDPPLIQSTGYEPAPLSPDGALIRRRVECETQRDFIFTHAMLARVSLDLRGGRVSTDGFDSSDPLYSTGSNYDHIYMNRILMATFRIINFAAVMKSLQIKKSNTVNARQRVKSQTNKNGYRRAALCLIP